MTEPQEVVELPRTYRWVSRYGPVFLCVVGLAMVLYAMFVKKPDSVLITLIIMGIGSVIVGVLLPRIKGPVEVGTTGVKTTIEGIEAIDAFRRVVAATAEAVAETTIPEQPNKEAMVARQVRRILDTVTLWLEQDPSTSTLQLVSKLHHPSRAFPHSLRDADPELTVTYDRFLQALREIAEREEQSQR